MLSLAVNHNSCFSLAIIQSFISCALGARYFPALEINEARLELEMSLMGWDIPSAWAQICPNLRC